MYWANEEFLVEVESRQSSFLLQISAVAILEWAWDFRYQRVRGGNKA